ncbi:MAG: hypothetical protein QNJ91_02775 [Gammaproteobacteria bacterium]|nr:hypothetical protein [Gammaproteobacteria bacterium]
MLLKFGRRVCVCMPSRRLQGGVRARIRPWRLGPLACWCDKAPEAPR